MRRALQEGAGEMMYDVPALQEIAAAASGNSFARFPTVSSISISYLD
jgi:hypothetical protein